MILRNIFTQSYKIGLIKEQIDVAYFFLVNFVETSSSLTFGKIWTRESTFLKYINDEKQSPVAKYQV